MQFVLHAQFLSGRGRFCVTPHWYIVRAVARIRNAPHRLEDYGIARAYRDTGRPVELPVYSTGRIPVQERHCGTSEMLVPVEIDLEKNTIALDN